MTISITLQKFWPPIRRPRINKNQDENNIGLVVLAAHTHQQKPYYRANNRQDKKPFRTVKNPHQTGDIKNWPQDPVYDREQVNDTEQQ